MALVMALSLAGITETAEAAQRWKREAPYAASDRRTYCSPAGTNYLSARFSGQWECQQTASVDLADGHFELHDVAHGVAGATQTWVQVSETHSLTRPATRIEYTAIVELDGASAAAHIGDDSSEGSVGAALYALAFHSSCYCENGSDRAEIIRAKATAENPSGTASVGATTVTLSFVLVPSSFSGGGGLIPPGDVTIDLEASTGGSVLHTSSSLDTLDQPPENSIAVHVVGRIRSLTAKITR